MERGQGRKLRVNRAPVLTLWAAVVAERLGFDPAEALSLGKAVAGFNAQSKGRRLGLFRPAPKPNQRARPSKRGKKITVTLLGRALPAVRTPKGVRALAKSEPIEPRGVESYLNGKFGDRLPEVRAAMTDLATAFSPGELNEKAFALYELFRPHVPEGTRGWGATGELDLEAIRHSGE